MRVGIVSKKRNIAIVLDTFLVLFFSFTVVVNLECAGNLFFIMPGFFG
jgi:hypothetical protein